MNHEKYNEKIERHALKIFLRWRLKQGNQVKRTVTAFTGRMQSDCCFKCGTGTYCCVTDGASEPLKLSAVELNTFMFQNSYTVYFVTSLSYNPRCVSHSSDKATSCLPNVQGISWEIKI